MAGLGKPAGNFGYFIGWQSGEFHAKAALVSAAGARSSFGTKRGVGRFCRRTCETQSKAAVMPDDFLNVQPRVFNSKPFPGLTNDARDDVNAALQALSTWRNEIVEASQKNGKRVIEKMAAAAATLRWPEQIVDSARTQLQSIAEVQIKTIDHMIDVWEAQIKLPNTMNASPSAMLSRLKSAPGVTPTAAWPGAEAFQTAAMNPLQLWMQVAEQWQKSWTDTMSSWGMTAGSKQTRN